MISTYEVEIGGKPLTIEAGKLAQQAGGAVTVRYGDTLILATATASKEPRPDVDFFPLTVDYEERMYAAGKIPGGFFKREGRPSETAILTCRLTDRPIRPMFPKGFRNDVQVILTVLSADQENEPDILSIIGASAALTISDIPFDGPVAAAKVGYIDDKFVINPTAKQLEQSKMELVVAGSEDAVVMVEAGAKELPESLMLEAIKIGHEASQAIIKLQKQMRDEIGKPKREFTPHAVPEEVKSAVEAYVGDRMAQAMNQTDKTARDALRDELKRDVIARFGETYNEKDLVLALESLEKQEVRTNILTEGIRPDGRDLTTIRPITCEVGFLPRTHGSGLFTRGQTQVLSIATLGSISDEQIIDGLGTEETKRFMHHYNMPPFSVGEVRRVGSPGRREIGHGALAERAIAAVIPPKDEFPYTVRLVSEVLSSNGSTSMGSVCGSILALMDAGVPIKAPVAGVAMGLITGDDGRFAVLTDIQGIEDHVGDMDFKVAGSADGVTALQMDIKIKGLSYDVMEKALAQARTGRLFILEKMLQTIAEARPELSPRAPRVLRTSIPVEKIGALIGPGGRTIRGIQEDTGAKIDVEEDGTVFVSSVDAEAAQKALIMVERLTKDVEIGGVYLGRVTRITNFGAFVEILPGKEGLVRVGDLADFYVSRPEDVVNIGDEIMVKVIEVDPQGRINLSRRAVLEGTEGKPAAPRRSMPSGAPGGGPGRPMGGGGRPRDDFRRAPEGERRPPYGPPRRPEQREGGGRPFTKRER
ncbi:MAG: polyribonucleotide nucleotidyltransferase [Chloroflexi bacterium]|nr:polyribonucleotide nucleotidyltransferase [Chloroflexota bacterium]